jgi:hypothetical protein
MAQTDSRAGFRLPWSTERSTDATETQNPEADPTAETGWTSSDQPGQAEDAAAHHETVESPTGDWSETPVDTNETTAPVVDGPRPATARKPSKFLAELTKAMQAAAEEARGLSLSQLQADAKSYVEKIHERSATEAADLRRAADDDVAAVREWSKAEIARIREETDDKITVRKGRLETEIEEHVARIEREIARVQGRVAAFEQEMADFFARLLAEEDPTRFATMAERLPEPPTFEGITHVNDVDPAYDQPAALAESVTDEAAAVAETVEPRTETEALETQVIDGEAGETGTAEATDASDESTGAGSDEAHGFDGSVEAGDVEIDREAAFAAIQAAAEAAASAEVATDAAARAEAVADIAIEIVGAHDGDGDSDAATTDFDAAEAEAAASTDVGGDVEEIPVIGDDALAARLADLLPARSDGDEGGQEARTTQVVVVGLVSVASIASFKRHLGRLTGVSSVGVSSGPEGEFLFAVHHSPEVVLRDVIPAMPSFQARVTGSGDGTLNVSAHDPESDN